MIPDLIDIGSLWSVLPPGVHEATLEEVETHFATSAHRESHFSGFKKAVVMLHEAGCKTILLDGSFVTGKAKGIIRIRCT